MQSKGHGLSLLSMMGDAPGSARLLGEVQEGVHNTGLLHADAIRDLIRSKDIVALEEITADQVQPASLDLRLGAKAYRVRASFLPGASSTVEDRLTELKMHEIDLNDGAVLERGCVYLVPLLERLNLRNVAGLANPKSSTGRLDIFTRLIVERATEFDRVPSGYQGVLYAEISPRTFSVMVRRGSRLGQLRFRRGAPRLGATQLRELQAKERLIDRNDLEVNGALPLTVGLRPLSHDSVIGYRAKRHTDAIDIDKQGFYDPDEFWEPIYHRGKSFLVLDPDEFYILVSRETVHVPPGYAAEMVPFDPLFGEFRVHYAGFFDPGFGHDSRGRDHGAHAVLEVRSHGVPFVLEHGQTVGRLSFERLINVPSIIYGQGIGSSYQRQALTLSKHFKRR